MPGTPHQRVLVVEDDASVRPFVDRVLREAGSTVWVAADGPEGLRMIARQPPFDLFVIDVMMQMRGDALATDIRRHDSDAKVLYFTGYSDELFRTKPMFWESEAFLTKPANVRALIEAVSLLLYGHTQGPQTNTS